jgi:AcrR family transcriptional regulator
VNELSARTEDTCNTLSNEGAAVTFGAVAERVGVSKATLYRRPELRAIVEEHRARDRDAHSLAGIVVELDHLRQGLEAVAAKVRRHEEEIRKLKRRSSAAQ